MTHDPLCPMHGGTTDVLVFAVFRTGQAIYCGCPLIARVRADERAMSEPAFIMYGNGKDEAAIRRIMREGYAAALRDAVEATYQTCGHTKYEGCAPCPHDDAVAAIEALGGNAK